MSDRLNKILADLPHLSGEELERVRSQLGVVQSLGGKAAPAPKGSRAKTGDDDLALSVLAAYVKDKGVDYSTAGMLRKSNGYSAFREKVPVVFAFISQGARTRPEQLGLLRIGIELLYENLVQMGVSVSARTVMAHFHRVPAVINEAYPGYATAGLLHIIIGKKKVQHVR